MNIKVNGMQYLKHSSYYFGNMGQYLVVVSVEDISTGMKKQYANFADSDGDQDDIEMIMRSGFKPKNLQTFLNEALTE